MDETIRVLFVDDKKTFSQPMSDALIKAGFLVDVATSGRQAISKVKANNGDYQVAIIDQVMGPPNGSNVMVAIRQLFPTIEAIILNGWDDIGGERAMELGAFRYFSKPVNINELIVNIRFAARFGQERKRNSNLQRLVSAGQRIGRAQNEQELYQQLYTEVKDLLPNLDGFLVAQYDEHQGVVNFPFCYRYDKPIKLASRSQGTSLTEYVLKNKEPLLLPYGDEAFRKTNHIDPPDSRLGYKKSEMIAPMFLDNRVIGTINALTYKENTYFTPDHLQIFQAFSNQIAPMICNVQQLVEARQLKNAVSALTGRRGRKAVLKAIVSEAHKLITSDFTGLILLDEKDHLYKARPVIPSFYFKQFDEPRQTDGLTRMVVKSGKPMVIPDTLLNGSVKKSVQDYGVRSMLIFPLCYGDKVLGVLYGHSRLPQYFSEHDIDLWTTFVVQASAVLHSTFEDERRAKDFSRLEQVTAALKGTSDVHSTMVKVATAAKNVFEANTCRLALVEPTTNRLVNWKWARGDPEKYRFETQPRSNGFTNRVFQSRKPVFHKIEDPSDPQPLQGLIDQGLRYTLSMPLLISGRMIGVLHCNYVDRQEPDYDRLKNLIPAFSDRAAIALYRTRHDRLNAIWHDLDQKIVTCNSLKELYKVFVEHAHRALRADLSIFYPFDPTSTDDLKNTIRDQIVAEGELRTPWQVPEGGLGGGVCGALEQAKNGQLIVNNLEGLNGQYASRLTNNEGIKAFIALRFEETLPGRDRPQTVGILFLNYRTTTDFEPRDLVALQSAGGSVAQEIMRLALQDSLQKSFEERNVLLRAVTDILRAFERDARGFDTKLIAEYAVEFLGIDSCTILEYDQDDERFIRRGVAGVSNPDLHFTIPKVYKTRFMDALSPTVILNVDDDDLFQSSNYIKREKIKRIVFFPLRVESHEIGLLIADYRTLVNIPQEKIDALTLFADFAALILHEAQLNAKLDATQQKLSRRIFLDWVSMIEASWRHSLVQRASTIQVHTAILNNLLGKANWLPLSMREVPNSIEMINQKAKEISDAPPRVPQSWELEPELIPLAPLLEEVVRRECSNPFSETEPLLKVEFQLEAIGGIQVRGYRRWIIYAIEALLQNARKAMPEGGQVTVFGQLTTQWVEVRICDTGTGIPKAIRHMIFKKLIPNQQDKAGMGIGSLLVSTIIEMHDGEVYLERPGPDDTTVLIRFPHLKPVGEK